MPAMKGNIYLCFFKLRAQIKLPPPSFCPPGLCCKASFASANLCRVASLIFFFEKQTFYGARVIVTIYESKLIIALPRRFIFTFFFSSMWKRSNEIELEIETLLCANTNREFPSGVVEVLLYINDRRDPMKFIYF